MNDSLPGKKILLAACGGVAVYKAVALTSRLVQAGAEVEVVMTPAALEFIRPLQFAALTHKSVHVDPWKADRRPEHIALAEWPDLAVVAPVTANTMAKLAAGIADTLLTSVLLATERPVLLAPAMNKGMWQAKATVRNYGVLQSDGYRFVGPGSGNLACGDVGIGRMAEPEEILEAIRNLLTSVAPKA